MCAVYPFTPCFSQTCYLFPSLLLTSILYLLLISPVHAICPIHLIILHHCNDIWLRAVDLCGAVVCCCIGPSIGQCFSVTILEINLNLVAHCHPLLHIMEIWNPHTCSWLQEELCLWCLYQFCGWYFVSVLISKSLRKRCKSTHESYVIWSSYRWQTCASVK